MTEDKSTVVVEDLMKPRYKCIADYPYNASPIGSIIENPSKSFEKELNKYPLIFKKLEWWEERKIEDMPEYVKDITANPVRIIKIDVWHYDNETGFSINNDFQFVNMWCLKPSTESEYLKYINQKA